PSPLMEESPMARRIVLPDAPAPMGPMFNTDGGYAQDHWINKRAPIRRGGSPCPPSFLTGMVGWSTDRAGTEPRPYEYPGVGGTPTGRARRPAPTKTPSC